MKQISQYSTLFLVLLLFISSPKLAATFMATKQGEADHEVSLEKLETEPLFHELMGLEECTGKEDDDECLKRRMTKEAHLDYIYTQHHKP